MEDTKKILSYFAIEGEVSEIAPLGNGLINDTHKVVTIGSAPDYVLQRINHSIFTDVDLLQTNIEAVTSHIRHKLEVAGESDINRKVLRFMPLKDSSKTYFFDGESYWRVAVFIPGSYTFETVNPEYSRMAGRAFGNFEAMLADLPQQLGETIPDFHNMELRLSQLVNAVKRNPAGRLSEHEVGYLLEDIDLHGEEMCKAEQLHREGKLPKRVCHCDTKVNNMLFDSDGNVLCVIDLDTVMPAYVFSDFGDFLRTAANTVAEDEPDVSKVAFRMDIFEAFSEGYIASTGSFLTLIERDNLPYGACLFPFMQAVRFLTDYINGDTYYKTSYAGHNLVRARSQMALFHSAISHLSDMHAVIARL